MTDNNNNNNNKDDKSNNHTNNQKTVSSFDSIELNLSSIQMPFLDYLNKNHTPVTVFLVCGVRLQGIVTHFDNETILLKREGHTQLVFKHSISTIMPNEPVTFNF